MVKCYRASAVTALEMMMGPTHRRSLIDILIYNDLCVLYIYSGLFQFLINLCSRLDNDYEQFQCWLTNVLSIECSNVHHREYCEQEITMLLSHILQSVQSVMLRHNNFTKEHGKITVVCIDCFSPFS